MGHLGDILEGGGCEGLILREEDSAEVTYFGVIST